MELTIGHYNNTDESFSQTKLAITDMNKSIYDICMESGGGSMVISFNRYYHCCCEIMVSDDSLPYIIRNGIVEWSVPYREISIKDFIGTHRLILDEGLYFESGYAMAGGPGYISIYEIWQSAWPVIKDIATGGVYLTGLLASAATLEGWIRNAFSKSRTIPAPHTFVEVIYRKLEWNHFELSQLLQIDIDSTKHWLKALGYLWTPEKQMYTIASLKAEQGLKKIQNVQYMDI